jgi:anti-sigma B factor antagonist
MAEDWTQVEVVHYDHLSVVISKGDLDPAAASEMRRTFTSLVDGGRVKLVVDLVNVAYIHSSGLAVVVEGMKRARAVGGDLRVCALREDVHLIFELTRLIAVMVIYPTRGAALAAWR